MVEGVARTARAGSTGTGWQRKAPATRLGSNLPEAARRRIAADWLADGYMEHASVGAFAKFALELLALGAPFELVRDAQAAMADEVLHARRCFDLALQYGHSDVVLGPLDFGVICADATLASVMRNAILEGCIGETLAATMAAHAGAAASEPAARAALAEIARDEGRHSELAWRFVAWALAHDPSLAPLAISTFEAALSDLSRVVDVASKPDEHAEQLSAHGRLTAPRKRSATQAALSEVILPCSRALFAAVRVWAGSTDRQEPLAAR